MEEEGYYEKFKKFVIEWELDSIPVAIFLVIASFVLIPVIFFTAGKAATAQPDVEPFYRAFQTLAIWLIFWFAEWLWQKRNWNETTSFLKNEFAAGFKDLPFEKKVYISLAITAFIFLSIVMVAVLVFP